MGCWLYKFSMCDRAGLPDVMNSAVFEMFYFLIENVLFSILKA